MRKLVILFLGFALTWFAAQAILFQQETISLYVRDGMALALLGAILFTLSVQAPSMRPSTLFGWPNWGQALFGAGVATALVGASLHVVQIPRAAVFFGFGVALLMVGAWVRGAPTRYALPAARWERNAQGHFVRRVNGVPAQDLERDAGRWRTLILLIILAAGVVARLWRLDGLSTACIGSECLSALALAHDQTPDAWLFAFAAQTIYALSGDALWSIRVAGACIGSLTLPAFWLAARRMAGADGALLGLLLLSFLPWHLWASRHAAPWIEAPLWISVVLWAGVAAVQDNDRRHWVSAAVALGLLLLAIPALSLAWLLWWLMLAALAFIGRREAARRNAMLAAAAGAPFFLTMLASPRTLPITVHFLTLPTRLWDVVAPLWIGDVGRLPLTALLAPAVCAALVMVGAAGLTRYRSTGAFILTGLALGILGLAWQASAFDPANDALILLTPLLLAATVAIDQLVGQTQRVWQAVIRSSTIAVVAGSVLLLALVMSAAHWRQASKTEITDVENQSALAAAQYMATVWSSGDANQPLVLLPEAFFDDPVVQLSAAESIQAGLARPFDLPQDLPFRDDTARDAARDVVYLFPAQEPALQRLAQAIYPAGESAAILGKAGEALLHAVRVPGAALADARGLAQTVFTRDGASEQSHFRAPLSFPWDHFPPEPFDAAWQGSLLIPAAGDYRFAVQAPPDALFTLLLDKRLALDTSAGLTEQTITLPQGWQTLDMRFRGGGEPGDLSVQWQPPGGEMTPIPSSALFNPPLPEMGLQATYYAGDAWDGLPQAQRKDWLIRPDKSLALPYSVHWRGKIAAPRGGETLLGVVTDGVAQVDVDGRRVIDLHADPTAGEMTGEGVITLAQGWHEIDVRYASLPDAPEFKLYWQPPGSGPAPLPPEMLTPTTVDLAAPDLPLPAPPSLVDERLGDDSFALSASIDLWQPRLRIPPADLASLPLEPVWKVSECGSGMGQFSAPQGMTLDTAHNRIYIADRGNRRVVSLGLDGQQFQVLPVEGLVEPVDVALSPDGSLLILDALLPGIVRFDPDNGSASTVGLPEDLRRPRGVAVDSLGLIYVADTGGARVAVFDADGRTMAEFGGAGSTLGQSQPTDVLATGRSIWTIGAEHGRLWQLDTLGSLTVIQPTDTPSAPRLAGLPDGRFFVSDPAGRRLVFLGVDGRPMAQFDAAGALTQPTGVAALASEGELLVAVTDAATCTVSLWRMALDELPE